MVQKDDLLSYRIDDLGNLVHRNDKNIYRKNKEKNQIEIVDVF